MSTKTRNIIKKKLLMSFTNRNLRIDEDHVNSHQLPTALNASQNLSNLTSMVEEHLTAFKSESRTDWLAVISRKKYCMILEL